MPWDVKVAKSDLAFANIHTHFRLKIIHCLVIVTPPVFLIGAGFRIWIQPLTTMQWIVAVVTVSLFFLSSGAVFLLCKPRLGVAIFGFAWLLFIVCDGIFFGGVFAPGICLSIIYPVLGIAALGKKYAKFFFLASIAAIVGIALLDFLGFLQSLSLDHSQYIFLVVIAYSLQIFLSFTIGKSYETARLEFEARLVEVSRICDLNMLAAGISHEINNPMTTITTSAGLIEKQLSQTGVDPAILKQGLARIQKAAGSVKTIIKLLGEYTQDRRSEPPRAFNINEVITDTLSLSRRRLEDAGIRVELSLSPSEVLVTGFRSEICRVLMTLINNSYDAVTGVESRWILISSNLSSKGAELSVTDSGAGIDPKLRKYLFAPFFTTKPPNKGLGLGLYFSSKIVEIHQGRIYLDETAQHTKFVIQLPVTG
jgi:signal transduction histidine kinase